MPLNSTEKEYIREAAVTVRNGGNNISIKRDGQMDFLVILTGNLS
jgi:hypothetical protein